MKRLNWKKILSLVLVLSLVVGTLTWNKKNASAADDDHHIKSITTDEGIVLTKELKNLTVLDGSDAGYAIADIVLTVDGANAKINKQKTGTTDIVFVMDLSNSMKYDKDGNKNNIASAKQRITAAKAAAISFATGVLTDDNKAVVKVGIASFGTSANPDKDLTNDLAEVKKAIDDLDVASNKVGGGGTNLQAGLHVAYDMLKDSQADNKIIVILSDGEPTYSYKATAIASEDTTLNDNSSARLLSAFDYSESKGSGSSYTFDSYSVGGKYKQSGWYYAEKYTNHSKDSFYTSDNSKVTYTGEAKEGTTGTYKGRYNTYKVVYHVQNGVDVANNGLPAISEAAFAKANNAVIYSIAYDVAKDDNAKYVMKNVASPDTQEVKKYFTATSGETTNTQTAIDSVIEEITGTVSDYIAAAKGTNLQDILPSYMTALSVSDTDEASVVNTEAASNNYGNKVDWGLSTLGEGVTKSLTVQVKIDLNKMVDAYAASNASYKDGEAVKAALATGKVIWFDMNQEVVLSYTTETDEGSKDVVNRDLSAVESTVPQEQFTAYNYIIDYVDENGNKIATSDNGGLFLGEEILVGDAQVFLDDTTLYDHTANGTVITAKTVKDNKEVAVNGRKVAMPAEDIVITVKYLFRDYSVTFKNGDKVLSQKTDYHYGDAVTNEPTETPTKDPSNEKEFTFKGWDKTITKVYDDVVYNATYSEKDRYYTVKFVDDDGTTVIPYVDAEGNEIKEQILKWNDPVNYPANPSKQNNTTVYNFEKWTRTDAKPNKAVCDGDAVYKASYTSADRLYKVTFYNTLLDENNEEYPVYITSEKYKYEATVTPPADPERPADKTFTYKFIGWDPVVTKVTKDDTEYFAQYESIYNEYSVTFKNGDTVIAQKTDYHYGDPVGDTQPEDKDVTKPDNKYKYTFKGWKVEGTEDTEIVNPLPNVTENVVYVAVFDGELIDYTVTFVNWNDAVLQSKTYNWGDTVKYEQAEPTKFVSEEDARAHYYTFTGWNSEITACEGNKTYKATFKQNDVEYTIVFVDEEGKEILKKTDYHYGDTVIEPEDDQIPEKATEYDADGTPVTTHPFAGWTPQVVNVVANATYTATYSDVTSQYTITFLNYDDTEISSVKLDYGATVTEPAAEDIKIQKEDPQNTYEFGGWNSTVTTVKKNATYKAVMTPIPKDYTIKFVNGGQPMQTLTRHWEEFVTYTGETPVKSDLEYTYTFSGWDPAYTAGMAVNKITFDENREAVFTAQFDKEEIIYTVKFVVDFGDRVETVSEQPGHYNHSVTTPDTPTKDDLMDGEVLVEEYEFDGWYLNGNKVDDSEIVTTATANLTYTGKFNPKRAKYTIKFIVTDIDGKTKTTVSEVVYPYGANITRPSVGMPDEETGFVPDVLSVKEDENGIVYQVTNWTPTVIGTCKGDAEYNCGYTIKLDFPYEVEFYDDGEMLITGVKSTYNYGEPLDVPTGLSKQPGNKYSYTFIGWQPQLVTENGVAVCKGNAKYYAQYRADLIPYNVSFVDYDGTAILVKKTEDAEAKAVNVYNYEDSIVTPEVTRKDNETFRYEFDYWQGTDAKNNPVSYSAVCLGTVVYTAVYKEIYKDYTVTFEDIKVNETEPAYSVSTKYHFKATVDVPANRADYQDAKYDYEFKGWAVKEENAVSGAAVTIAIAPLTGENDPVVEATGDITYVSVYEPKLRVFNVKFVDQNGNDLGDKGYASKVTYGETVEKTDCEDATSAARGNAEKMAHDTVEYFFAGWQIENEDGNKVSVTPDDFEITKDTKFYASYVEKLDFEIFYHGSNPEVYGVEGEDAFRRASVKEGSDYTVITEGPSLAETPTTKFVFIGWSTKYIAPDVFPDATQILTTEEAVRVFTISRLSAPTFTTQYVTNEFGCVEEIKTVANKVDLYPVYKSIEKKYTVTYMDGSEKLAEDSFIYKASALGIKPADRKGWSTSANYVTTIYTFAGWDVSDAELGCVTRDMVVHAKYDVRYVSTLPPFEEEDDEEPVEEPNVPVDEPDEPEEEIITEEPETPQGPVEEEPEEEIIPPQPETPQGAPEEEVDLDDVETPQGDLPKTGTTPVGVFFGIGAACIMLGGVMLKGIRRREDEM